MQPDRKPILSRFGRSLLKVLVIMVVSLLLVEVLMTAFEPYMSSGLFQYDPELGFRVRPHVQLGDGTTNQFGFNSRDYPLEKSPGVFRILVLGDSFNWAGGRKGNYTALLEQKLDSLHGSHKVDVINAGYPGTHTGEELAILKKFGLQYHPDLVILGFFVGNDFTDADPNRKRIIVHDTYIDIDRRYERRLLGRPIVFNSRLFLFLQQKYAVWKSWDRETQAAAGPQTSPPLARDVFLDVEQSRLDFFDLRAAKEKVFQTNIDYILQSISEMDALLRSQNTALVVAIFPDEFQVNQDLFKALIERTHTDAQNYDLEFAQKMLKSFLETKGIPYVDFLPRFRAAAQEGPLYLPQNTHWNEKGNELAAQILLETLVNRSDVPKPAAAPAPGVSQIRGN